MRCFPITGIVAVVAGLSCVRIAAQPASFSLQSGGSHVRANSSQRLPEEIIADRKVAISDRIVAVYSLGRNLDHHRVNCLLDFLAAHEPSDDFNRDGLRKLKNEIMTAVRAQNNPPSGLTGVLLQIWSDQGQDEVVRDYALQHLASWFEEPTVGTAADRIRVRATLNQAARQRTSSAGTAILGLHRWSKTSTDTDLDSLAVEMVGSAELPDAARISALQVCAERNLAMVLPQIKDIAKSSRNPVLRAAAISAIGQLGGVGDLRLLQSLESQPAIEPAIQSAIKRLTQKISNEL